MVKYNVSQKRFEELREQGKSKADVCYQIDCNDGKHHFAWSNDGEGFFFYDNLDELKKDWE